MPIYLGINKVKGVYLGTKKVKSIWMGLNKVWTSPSGVTYLPILPDDTATYPMYRNDTVLEFAVTDGTQYGYYAPSTEQFTDESGMTGTVIERVEHIHFDGIDCCVNTGINLTGADTVTVDFLYNKSGSNIFGSWRSSNTNVYSLYASASKSYVRYAGSLYRTAPVPINTRVTYKMTPTGNYVDDIAYDTWSQVDFDSDTPCFVGWLNGSGSPHLGGNVYEFTIDDKCHLIPVKIGTTYYLFDILRWSIPSHNGTFGGGSVVSDPIPFPEEIPAQQQLLTMGGNPFYPPGPGAEPEDGQ